MIVGIVVGSQSGSHLASGASIFSAAVRVLFFEILSNQLNHLVLDLLLHGVVSLLSCSFACFLCRVSFNLERGKRENTSDESHNQRNKRSKESAPE